MAENAVTPGVSTGEASAHARDPFVLDIRSLGRRPGTMTEVHRTAVTPERLGLEMIGIPAASEVDLDLRLESVSEEFSSAARSAAKPRASVRGVSNPSTGPSPSS